MNGVWLVLGLVGVAAGVVAMILMSQRRGRQTDLGFVSTQWVSEHRLSQTQDSRR